MNEMNVSLECGLLTKSWVRTPWEPPEFCGCLINHNCLRTFAPIATAHPYSARKFTCHVMHRARAISTKMNNDRGNGHCYSFAWI